MQNHFFGHFLAGIVLLSEQPQQPKQAAAGRIRSQNRERILRAAEHEFAISGFKGATVQNIAQCAELPKTNVLYYFSSKKALYLAVLEDILSIWNAGFDSATVEDDPAVALAQYIAAKMTLSRSRPQASKIFALEVINGAPNMSDFFEGQYRDWVAGRVAVIQGWIDAGKMAPRDPYNLLFNIWSCCQHFADFGAEISKLRGAAMTADDFDLATKELVQLILTGCGLTVPQQYRFSD